MCVCLSRARSLGRVLARSFLFLSLSRSLSLSLSGMQQDTWSSIICIPQHMPFSVMRFDQYLQCTTVLQWNYMLCARASRSTREIKAPRSPFSSVHHSLRNSIWCRVMIAVCWGFGRCMRHEYEYYHHDHELLQQEPVHDKHVIKDEL